MAEMTMTPVATHGFLVDGRWLEEGDLVEVRSPYDGAVVGRVFQVRSGTRNWRLRRRSKHSEPPGASRHSSASAYYGGC